MISDIQIADLLIEQYGYSGSGPSSFDFFEPGQGDSGICWSAKRIDGVTHIQLRGSRTLKDWFRDFIAVVNPFDHSFMGPVHTGFALGMDRCWAQIQKETIGPYYIEGHSLGGGRVPILIALMIESGVMPLGYTTFGQPRPGFQKLADICKAVPGRNYRNGDGFHHDYVTDFPVHIEPLFLYVHPAPMIVINCPPVPETLSVFGRHHMGLYRQALVNLSDPAASSPIPFQLPRAA